MFHVLCFEFFFLSIFYSLLYSPTFIKLNCVIYLKNIYVDSFLKIFWAFICSTKKERKKTFVVEKVGTISFFLDIFFVRAGGWTKSFQLVTKVNEKEGRKKKKGKNNGGRTHNGSLKFKTMMDNLRVLLSRW